MNGMTLAIFATVVITAGNADSIILPIDDDVAIHFLNGSHARDEIVDERDDPFFQLLSRIDVEVRVAEPLPNVGREQRIAMLKKSYRDAVVLWSGAEIDTITQACRAIYVRSRESTPGFVPKQWKFIKTDGSEEAGASYTRGDAIILSQQHLARSKSIAKLVAHETAHVFSRLNPEIRNQLYRRLGFTHVGQIELGPFLNRRRLTNPDGPAYEHTIRVNAPNGAVDAVLVIFSKADQFAPEQGRRLFDYLQSKLFVVDQTPDGRQVRYDQAGNPVGFAVDAVTGFYEQIGRNTKYIIHPDEILADNLALLLGQPSLTTAADPMLIRDLAKIIQRENQK